MMRSIIWPAAVSMMTPTEWEARRSRVSASPSSPGRLISIRTISIGRLARTFRMPSPSPATDTSKPQNSKYSLIVSRTSLSSSTTRILPLSVMGGAGLLAFLDLAQQAQHIIWQERLLQIGQPRVRDEGLNFGCQRVAGDEGQPVDHRRRLSLQGLVKAKAVEIWHSEIAQNHIVVVLQSHFEASPAIGSRVDPVTLAHEDLAQCIENLRLVLDDQDAQALARSPLQRFRPLIRRNVLQWQPDGECRAAARPIGDCNCAGMRANDAQAERQPDPGAFADRLRREERLEDPLTDVQRHTRAIVGNRNFDHAALAVSVRRNANDAAWRRSEE